MPIRDTLRAVERILFDVWDPIDVKSSGAPADEYSAYAPQVVGLLQRGATDVEIAEYLASVESAEMGLTSATDANRLRAAAEARATFDRAAS